MAGDNNQHPAKLHHNLLFGENFFLKPIILETVFMHQSKNQLETLEFGIDLLQALRIGLQKTIFFPMPMQC